MTTPEALIRQTVRMVGPAVGLDDPARLPTQLQRWAASRPDEQTFCAATSAYASLQIGRAHV